MIRQNFDRYVAAFNARDYDAVYDFYADGAELAFFGVHLRSRGEFRDFYAFLHDHVRETVVVDRFAGSDELVALEAVVRVEAVRDLDRATLDARGLQQFHAMVRGDVVTMRQFIHYHLREGRFIEVECILA